MRSHRYAAEPSPQPKPSFRTKLLIAALTVGALVLTAGGIARAVTAGGQVTCPDGVDLLVHPDGTWDCGQPTPSPSTSPSASPSPSSSPTTPPSPTASPSPSTTPSPSASTTAPATTPPASPSPTGPQRNCLANLAACGFPNDLNTGPTTTTATLNGNQSFNSANTLVANTRINGCVEVRGANVIFRNVLVNASGCFWAFRNWGTNLVLEDVEITCGDQPGSNGFSNAGTTTGSVAIRRADIHHCENGLNVPGNTTLVDSWIHDLYDGGDAHTDGAQFNQGASNISFVHNTIDARGNSTSAIIQWDESNPQNSNVLIDGNLLAGGSYTLYCARQGPVTNVRITSNRFGPYAYGSSNDCVGNHVTEWSGNVTDSTGAPLAAA